MLDIPHTILVHVELVTFHFDKIVTCIMLPILKPDARGYISSLVQERPSIVMGSDSLKKLFSVLECRCKLHLICERWMCSIQRWFEHHEIYTP